MSNRTTNNLTRRQFTGIVAGGTLATLAGGHCLAQTADGDAFFFIAGADPQLFWGSAESWGKAVGHINRLSPPFAVILGDLINRNGNAKKINLEKDEEMAQAYLKVAKKVDPKIKLYNVAGNHDVCNEPTPETLKWYEQRFGPPWYSFTHKKCLFVVLESDVLKNPKASGDAAERQMKWLRETFKNAEKEKYNHAIVCMHHPMCLKAVDEKDAYFNMPTKVRKELLDLFHKNNVKAVFSGHYHRNALVTDGDIELVTNASTGKALGKDPLGMRIVKVYPDRIEHAYYGFDLLPDKVEL